MNNFPAFSDTYEWIGFALSLVAFLEFLRRVWLRWRELSKLSRSLAIAGIFAVCGFLLWIVREWPWAVSALATFFGCCIFGRWWYARYHEPRLLNGEIKKTYDNQKFKRFEEVTTLVGGFIEYSPFLWTERDEKKGIGVEVLRSAFPRCNIQWHTAEGGWDNIFEELCCGTYDIIVTPLFETRSRLHDYPIIFCAPLFYSSIGIYVRKSDSPERPMNWAGALSFLRTKIKELEWKGDYIPGEISESLARKHKLALRAEVKEAADRDFSNILSRISVGHSAAQFVFMEVFKAESIMTDSKMDEKDRVVNILAENELLYPVSFAVRKEDTVLRNLINLRLLEMRDSKQLEMAFKRGVAPLHISDATFERMWVQRLPGSEGDMSGRHGS